ncbi:hypothetical protein LPB140_12000 [Sphingorhabdus lutea]|uniref:Folate-binding protein YgfZ n=1 Tax=Sphingorhabdus lutea TaxID=1913578 RepID=A0A1L3JFE9_9SPHN|nr:hypothetical protein [Sphingorhabdus lutea]APG63844.1 hypothetical protein LPB140_12000 [Sphingorhabdus lutea]
MTENSDIKQLNNRSVVKISPQIIDGAISDNVRDFLQGLLTQDMRKVAAGTPQYGALLSAQGKVLFDMIIWDAEDVKDADIKQSANCIFLDVEAQYVDELIKKLSLYRLRRKITIERTEMAVLWSLHHHDQLTADPRMEALGYRGLSASCDCSDATDIWRKHRLSQGVVEGRDELGHEKHLWLECNAIELNGVAFDKGCYVGQENTARMNWRSKINRRIVVLPLAEADAKRQIIAYDDLGLSVEHRRVEDFDALTLPNWLKAAVKQDEGAEG